MQLSLMTAAAFISGRCPGSVAPDRRSGGLHPDRLDERGVEVALSDEVAGCGSLTSRTDEIVGVESGVEGLG